MSSRRSFLQRAMAIGAGAFGVPQLLAQSSQPNIGRVNNNDPRHELASANVPVHTPDLPDLPFTLDDGTKVFHLIAEPVKRQIAPNKTLVLWGFNGTAPGPTIQVNQGDRVRIILDNHLPEPSSMHWHGFEIPNDVDGGPGVSQAPIKPGGRFVYEFILDQAGTYFYHPHMAMQEMMGNARCFHHAPEGILPPRRGQRLRDPTSGICRAAEQRGPEFYEDGVQLTHHEWQSRPCQHPLATLGGLGSNGLCCRREKLIGKEFV